jgi:ankyrin repeat protein
MSDGKTLFYHACLEGNLEVVQIFLEKNLNPSILSKNDFNEYETCLQVSARWGYNEIVNLILEKRGHLIKNEELENTLKIKNLKSSIIKLLKEHLKNKKGKRGCACF